MTTRPLVYNGSFLFANVVLQPGGRLRVSLLPPTDEDAPATSMTPFTSGRGLRSTGMAIHAPRVLCSRPNGGAAAAAAAPAVSAALEGPLDSTKVRVEWPAGDDEGGAASGAASGAATGAPPPQTTLLGKLSGRRVRLQFELQGGELFAFWLSHDPSGASGGYLGGGALGATSIVDR